MRAKLIDDLATAQDKYEHCQRVAAELSELGRSVAEEREEAKTAFDEAQRKVTQPRRPKPRLGRPLQQRVLVKNRPRLGNSSTGSMSSRRA
ncbi:DNA double-strand break repair Rad50 ATPase [Cutibacterium acnes JCM 18916]|nr:DNA double-strand break repair Rad50 ATPase [Cutibacterium acnes JCM 18916]GAE78248.1 DNA double-strand break repair Rad50 ATPase [Cutibacterium acnes JCM 18918]